MEYKVKLPIFEGPLDLLLYLIKKDELDIYNIPIERITKQYMQYLEAMRVLNIEVAGEFLVMAATLMLIKSKMLLPADQQVHDEEDEEELDPRWDLVRQLIEYKKFKDAAEDLQRRETEQEKIFPRGSSELGFDLPKSAEMNLGEVSVFDLINSFNQVLKRFNQQEDLREIFEDRFTVSDKIDFILKLTAAEPNTAFSKLFDGAASKGEVVVTFLALLELIRLKQLRIVQPTPFADIEIIRLQAA
jgi:segregation and condensation protein A